MIANTAVEKGGAHTVSLKTTGHEKAKITVCLTACANGDKKKPFFVFKGAKPPHITSVQYCGGCSVHWRLFSTSGG